MSTLNLAMAVALLAGPEAAPLLRYDEAISTAIDRSADLRAVQARLEQARVVGWKAWSAQLPQVSASASWVRNDRSVELPASPEPIALQPLIGRSAQVQATLTLLAPQLWLGIGAAVAGQREAESSVERARQGVLYGVAELYHAAAAARLSVGVAERQREAAAAHQADAGVRQRAGTLARAGLVRAELDLVRAEQELEVARSGYAASRLALAVALDRSDTDFEVEPPPEAPAPPAEAELLALALRERPEVRAAEASAQAARLARAALWAGYLPALGAFARGQWQDPAGLVGERRSWSAGLTLTWSIFDGTLREARLREEAARLEEAKALRHATDLCVREEVGRAARDLQTARANLTRAGRQVELARENRRLVDVGFREGAATPLEVSDASQQLATAELAAVGEQLKARLAALRLQRAAGARDPR